jgi:hypothetical protein
MPAATKKSLLSPKKEFEVALNAVVDLFASGKMTAFVQPDGSLDCQVSSSDVQEACGPSLPRERFEQVFNREIRLAMWLLASGVDDDLWAPAFTMGSPDSLSAADQEAWQDRVKTLSDRMPLEGLKRHFRHKTRGVLPALVSLERETVTTDAGGQGPSGGHRKVVLKVTVQPPQGDPSASPMALAMGIPRGLRLFFGGQKTEDTLVLCCDATDLDYLMRQLKEARDELAEE